MKTHTATETITAMRFQVVRDNIEWFLARLLPEKAAYFQDIIVPLLESQDFRAIEFYGVNHTGTAEVLLRVGVNWSMHRRITEACSSFRKPPGWESFICPEIDVALMHFEPTYTQKSAS